MEYFWIREDRRYQNVPQIQDFYSMYRRKDFMDSTLEKIQDRNVVYSNSSVGLNYVDIMDQQMFAVSRQVHDVFLMYNQGMKFKQFCFLNNELDDSVRYFVPALEIIPCINKSNCYNPILIEETLKNQSVFRVGEAREDTVVIRLDVAESLLRRKIRKFKLVKLDIESR